MFSLFGPPNIEKLKKKGNVKGLLKVLAIQRETPLRRAAVKALGEIGDPLAVEPLLELLNEEEIELRPVTLTALAALGEARAVEPLVKLLYTDQPNQAQIIKTLIEIDVHQAVERLITRLTVGHRHWETFDLLRQFGPLAVEPLIARLDRTGDNADQKRLLHALAQTGTDRAVAYLADRLPEAGYKLRPEIVEALGVTGNIQAVEPLIAALQHHDSDVQRGAMKALGRLKTEQAIGPLLRFVPANDERTRHCALAALSEIGGETVIEKLAEALASAPHSREISQTLVDIGEAAVEPLLRTAQKGPGSPHISRVLGQIGDPRAVDWLVTALQDEQAAVRRAAAEALEALNWQPDQPISEARYLIAAQKWDRLAELGPVALAPAVIALRDKQWQIRRSSAQLLGQIGDDRAVEPLLAALADEKADVWLAAAIALTRLGWQPDRPASGVKLWIAQQKWADLIRLAPRGPIVALLIAALDSHEATICAGAAGALGEIGSPDAVEPLIAALQDRRWDEQVAPQIAAALGRLGRPEAVKPLLETLYYGADPVAAAAVEALTTIGQPAVEPLLEVYLNREALLCVEIFEVLGRIGGSEVVDALLPALADRAGIRFRLNDSRRPEKVCQAAARSLVALYQAGNLDSEAGQKILVRRDQMTAGHTDTGSNRPHTDEMRKVEGWCIAHVDEPAQSHTDTGIGIDFPL